MSTPGIPQEIRGSLDGLVDTAVAGWAYDALAPGSQMEIEILVDGEVAGRGIADRYRPDLLAAGLAGGHCAFEIPVEIARWADGLPHEIRARAAGTDLELERSPQSLVIGSSRAMTRKLEPFAADTVLSRVGSLDAVRERLAVRGRLAIMASFQLTADPPKHLLNYLSELRAHDVAVVLVDTTVDGLDLPDGLVPLLLRRENVGWDFASWLAGLHETRALMDETEELIITNDSVFGPLFPLQESWDSERIKDADFWGLTDSWSIEYHVQSFFIVLRKAALSHSAFWTFLEEYPFPEAKRQVVRDGEIGLTTALHRAGLRSAVTCPYDVVARAWLDDLGRRLAHMSSYPENAFLDTADLDRALHTVSAAQSLRHTLEAAHQVRRGLSLNGSHFFWDTLIRDFRFPFVKRELLQINPAEIPFASELGAVLADTGYDMEHIRDAARRARGVRVVTL